MVLSPFFWMPARWIVPGFVIAAILAAATYFVMLRVAAPIAGLGGANLPRRLMKAKEPVKCAKKVVEALRKLPSGQGVEAAVRVFAFDFVFLAAFFLVLALWCEVVGRYWSSQPGAGLAGAMAWLALVSALSDVLEDTVWRQMILHDKSGWAPVAAWATRTKWLALAPVAAFLVISTLLHLVDRGRS